MLCILHKDKIPIHAMNREQLYQEYVAFHLSRREQRQNPEGEKTPRPKILNKYHETLLKFGELANINRKSNTQEDDDYSDTDESSDSEYYSCKSEYDSDGVNSSDNEDEYDSDRDDEDIMELSFTLDQIKSIIGEDALNYGYLYKSHSSSRLISSRYSFKHKTLHEFFLAYFIKHHNLASFKQRICMNRDLLKQELSLTRFILHLYMSPEQGFEFTTNIIGSKPDKKLFIVLLKLYQGFQHDEYQTTLTFNTTQKGTEYIYIYQYPCYVIRADRRYHHPDSLSSFNKDMIRRMNTDNKHKAVTVPPLQTDSTQVITCGFPLHGYDFHVYCRPDYEVTVRGYAGKLKKLSLRDIEKMGDINLHQVNDSLRLNIEYTNLHGLTKPWMGLIQSLMMWQCKLEAGDISVIADSIQACTSPKRAESASPCGLQDLDLRYNNLTGAGADIARIIPLCTRIDLTSCKLEAGDISVIADRIQACTSPRGAESASPCGLQDLEMRDNRLTGAGADIAMIIKCIPLCKVLQLSECDLNDEDFHAVVIAIIQTHSDRHTSVHDHSKPDRRQTSRMKPTSPGPASHIEKLWFWDNKFSDVETVRLLLDNLPSSLLLLDLSDNQFKEKMEIRKTYKDKHPNLDLWI